MIKPKVIILYGTKPMANSSSETVMLDNHQVITFFVAEGVSASGSCIRRVIATNEEGEEKIVVSDNKGFSATGQTIEIPVDADLLAKEGFDRVLFRFASVSGTAPQCCVWAIPTNERYSEGGN